MGSRQVEVLLFSDHFCPPCRNLEPYLEQTLPEVDIEFFDIQPLIDQWKELMEKHHLRSTPTYVTIKPDHKP